MEMETRTRKVRPEINMQVDSPKIPDHVNCRCKPDYEKMTESAETAVQATEAAVEG